MKADEDAPDVGKQTVYEEVQHSEEFEALRKRFRAFVFPMTALFLVWYAAYALLAIYAHDFMSQPVFGLVNVAMLFGLGQFVSTFVIAGLYVRWANKTFDPQADALRATVEKKLGVN
jgi:uncharacterized membrane protein (DUF485 family)